MDDELVQVPRLLAEARLAVAALLAGAELVLEQRVVLRANDGEVVGHGGVIRATSGGGRREWHKKQEKRKLPLYGLCDQPGAPLCCPSWRALPVTAAVGG